MGSFFLRPKAIRDLEQIGDYTLENWGENQEEIYLRMINKAFADLSGNPDLGRACDDIHPGLRKFSVGRHFVFYLLSDTGIDVVRILHKSMDVDRHL